MTSRRRVAHGVRANLPQFLLLLAVSCFVGATVGVERSVLPLLGRDEFGLERATAITFFIAAFGISKAFTNLAAGWLADRLGRRRVLLIGWLIGIPVPILIVLAPSWSWVVIANVLLGINQGLCWTLALFMKIDIGGPQRRGIAAGANETVGYLCMALAGFAATEVHRLTGSARPEPFVIALAAATLGLVTTMILVRETRGHVAVEHEEAAGPSTRPSLRALFATVSRRDPALFAAVQAGFTRNLADGMAWGLLLLVFADSVGKTTASTLTWVLVACFGGGQIVFGALSDRFGRRPFVVGGMGAIALSLVLIASTSGVWPWTIGVVILGFAGSAMYPTVIASISDRSPPAWRASSLGVYRFWRDLGYAVGALGSALVADLVGRRAGVYSVAAVCLVSAVVAAVWLRESRRVEAVPAPIRIRAADSE